MAYLPEMERKDGDDDKRQPGSVKKRLFKQESSCRRLRSHIKAGGGRAARVARGGVRCLMHHHPCPVYFLPYSPSSSSHASSLSPQIINLYLLPKNTKTCWVVVLFHTSLLPPAHHVFVDLIFLLEFLICKRVKSEKVIRE